MFHQIEYYVSEIIINCRELLDLSGSEAHELSAFMSSVGSREVGTSNRRWHT